MVTVSAPRETDGASTAINVARLRMRNVWKKTR